MEYTEEDYMIAIMRGEANTVDTSNNGKITIVNGRCNLRRATFDEWVAKVERADDFKQQVMSLLHMNTR